MPGNRLDDILGAVNFGSDERSAAEIRKGMRIGVVADGVSLGDNAARNLGVALDVFAAEEERRHHSSLA